MSFANGMSLRIHYAPGASSPDPQAHGVLASGVVGACECDGGITNDDFVFFVEVGHARD